MRSGRETGGRADTATTTTATIIDPQVGRNANSTADGVIIGQDGRRHCVSNSTADSGQCDRMHGNCVPNSTADGGQFAGR